MDEVLRGVFHWSILHPRIRQPVHSAFITATEPAVLIDPMDSREPTSWFADQGKPRHVLLTNRHHYRRSGMYVDEFDCEVWCHKDGLHEFEDGPTVRPFDHGDELAGGIRAIGVGVLCPEETALLIPHHGGMLAIGDAIVHEEKELALVPDALMGEDPATVKRGLRDRLLERLEEVEFDHLLFAHGEPLIGGAKDTLWAFLENLDV